MNGLHVQLLLTGNELMAGDVVDSNSSMIAQELMRLGINITRKVTVSDEMDHLIEEITQISQKADILIINGGLGPTVDDLTAQALAKVIGVPLTQHPEALTHITQWCERRGFKLNEPNLKQTYLPQGCDILANRYGSAVGFTCLLNECKVYCTPGVPVELSHMIVDEIIPDIESYLPEGQHYQVDRFQIFGIGESTLQKMLNESFPDWPDEIEIGFRASMPLMELKLTTKSSYSADVKHIWIDKLKQLLGAHLVAQIDQKPQSFAHHVQKLLRDSNATITTAESCTGGMIASAITKESGSSAIFKAGFVTYSNDIKQSVLNVDANTLMNHGAVSQETVIEMAQGALHHSTSDYVIATSGVAGPDGGTDEKPVGTVWIAWGTNNHLDSVCLSLPGSRVFFQHYVTAIGLDLIRRLLINCKEIPLYIKERQKT